MPGAICGILLCMETDPVDTLEINPATAPQASIIWLHGLGASGDDFVPVLPLLERPDLLEELVVLHDAKDATARQTALAELQKMEVSTSQFNPEQQIPEKSWAYRLTKRFLFSDFGAYNGYDHSESAAPFILQAQNRKSETAASAP